MFPIRPDGAPDDAALPSLAEALARLDAAEARIADKDTTIADLRHRLDEERAERRQTSDRLAAAQERIAALLTHQGALAAICRIAAALVAVAPRVEPMNWLTVTQAATATAAWLRE